LNFVPTNIVSEKFKTKLNHKKSEINILSI
jgi:hypothetical protein